MSDQKQKHASDYTKKALVCRCGKAYSMMARLPEAEQDEQCIKDFKECEDAGRKIVYLKEGEGEWHSPSDCIDALYKYKTACEQINSDNPMAVVELLPELNLFLEQLRYADVSQFNRTKANAFDLLTKLTAKK